LLCASATEIAGQLKQQAAIPYKNFSILFVFYTYFNFVRIYFIAVLLVLKLCFIIPNHKIARKIDYFNPIWWKRCFVR